MAECPFFVLFLPELNLELCLEHDSISFPSIINSMYALLLTRNE